MRVDVVRPSELGETELATWSRLQASEPRFATPFLSPGWALAVEAAQGERGDTKVAILHENGTPRGFFTARTVRRTALPSGAPMCDYQGVVGEPGVRVSPAELVRALGVARLDFSHMLADDPVFGGCASGTDESFIIDLSAGYAGWEADRRAAGSGVTKDMAKRRRKLERDFGPVVFTALSQDPADLALVLEMKREKFRQTGQTDVFDTPWTRKLVEGLHATTREDARAGVFTLHAGERLVAAQINLMSVETLHAWLITHDDAAVGCSPGLLLLHEIMRWMDGSRRELDLGPVAFGFKDRFANARRPIAYGFAGGLSPATVSRAAQYGVRRTVEKLPLGRVSAWPGKAMRRIDLWRALA